MSYGEILTASGLGKAELSGGALSVSTPIDGSQIARLKAHAPAEVELMIKRGVVAFRSWRDVPAPRRGELVRLFGEELRAAKESLGRLVTL